MAWERTLVSGSLLHSHTHLCYLEDTVHGGHSLLPRLIVEVAVKAWKIKRDQAGHGEPQEEHVAGLPGLQGQVKATWLLRKGIHAVLPPPPAQRPPRPPNARASEPGCRAPHPTTCPGACSQEKQQKEQRKIITCQSNGFSSLAPFSMKSAFQENGKQRKRLKKHKT